MNTEPHTHKPRVERRWSRLGPAWDNAWEITYGDTTVRICNGRSLWPPTKKVRKATEKALRLHDVAGVRAGQIHDMTDEAQRVADEVTSEWGKR